MRQFGDYTEDGKMIDVIDGFPDDEYDTSPVKDFIKRSIWFKKHFHHQKTEGGEVFEPTRLIGGNAISKV